MKERKLSAWDLVDEVLSEMSDENFGYLPKDRIRFRNALIEEVKEYLRQNGEIVVAHEEPENPDEEFVDDRFLVDWKDR